MTHHDTFTRETYHNNNGVSFEKRRLTYAEQDPRREENVLVFAEQKELYEAYGYQFPQDEWELHYAEIISRMPIDELVQAFRIVSLATTKNSPEITKEYRIIAKELALRCSISEDIDYSIKKKINETGSDDRFLEVNIGGENLQVKISNRRFARDLPDFYTHRERQRKEAVANVIESLNQGVSAKEILRQYVPRQKGIEMFEQSIIEKCFRIEIIVDAVKKAVGTQSDSTMDFDEWQPNELKILDTLKSVEDFQKHFETFDEMEKARLSSAVGNYLGKLASRTVRFPESNEVLLRLIELANIPQVAEAIQERVKEEAPFWGKVVYDPMDDLAKMALYDTIRKGASLNQTILLAQAMNAHLSVDLTKGNIMPVPQNGIGSIYNRHLKDQSENSQLGGPGLYFGIFGGFRNWNMQSATHEKSTRAVITNFPIGLTGDKMSMRAEKSIQADSLDFPEEAYSAPSEENRFNHVIDGRKVKFVPYKVTDFSFNELQEAPILNLHAHISQTIVETFKHYFPDTRQVIDIVDISGKYKFPFLSLPEDSDPVVVRKLMQHFQIANITYH